MAYKPVIWSVMLRYARRIPPWVVWMPALAWIVYLMFIRTWVSEDAYITFRVIDNLFHGYGLRWNIHERVQVYTHPLWMLLHIPVYALWHNLFYTSAALSITCSTAALLVMITTVNRPLVLTLGLCLLPFALSKSVMDYTSSGLETPLCYLTFAAFGYVVMRMRRHRNFWFYCSLSAALALFNRLDTIILYAPALAWLVFSDWRQVRWNQILLGALPLIAWFYFSLFYYGFFFPNTKYAKLDTGFPLSFYLGQSVNYVKYLFIFDLAGFITLCASLCFLFGRKTLALCIALGIYFYWIYILYIGGDYMAGRFWALPIFASIWLWYTQAPERMRVDIVFAIACTLVAAYYVSPMLRSIHQTCNACIEMKGRIIDARGIFHLNRLVTRAYPLQTRKEGHYPFCRDGKKLAKKEPPVEVMFYVGMHAYCAGPRLKAIDMLGLGDPLIARLPASKRQGFYIGHFRRDVPKGYPYAVDTGSTSQMNPSLAQYYEKLRLITSGALIDRERLKTIVLFNLGYYDHWKYDYLHAGK